MHTHKKIDSREDVLKAESMASRKKHFPVFKARAASSVETSREGKKETRSERMSEEVVNLLENILALDPKDR